jgi:two-component system LytT family response regulator
LKENHRMRVLVVDDEDLARVALRQLLSALPDVEVVGEAANGFEAVKLADALEPDLLFLDIQMPKLSGFEVLDLLEDRYPAVFVTAYDEYALRAFEVHAIDYLLKPVDPARLREALDRLRERAVPRNERPNAATLAVAAHAASQPADRVLIREAGIIHVLESGRIDYIEANDDAVGIVVAGRKYRKSQRLADIAATLDPGRFVRIHRSILLNIDRLARLSLYAKDSWIAILKDGTKLPISRAGHARLKELLGRE